VTAPPVYRNALPMQSMLQEYRIEQVLGTGGFGITYRARDANLDKEVAIKEYLPGDLAMRAPDGKVVAQATQHEAGYQWGLERFLLEARTLAKFSHPHIVRVLRYFEANATAYMVMDYEQGDPLKVLLQHEPRPPEAKLKALVAPLLEGLEAVHAAGFLHRDIKPDNIFVRADGRPVLIDFGAARQALGGETKSLTSILTPGYAPLEQYSGEGKQGPWTDLYALGGVLYRAVVDKNPPDAVARLREDSLGAGLGSARQRYSAGFLRAIEWALALDEKARPQSVAQWRAALLQDRPVEKTVVAAPRPAAAPSAKAAPARTRRARRWPWVFAAVAIVLIAAVAVKRHRAQLEEQREAQAAAAAAAAEQRGERREERRVERFMEKSEADFRAGDANGDGFLTREEVRQHFPAVAREFARYDRNGDGRLSREEFLEARRGMIEQRLRNGN